MEVETLIDYNEVIEWCKENDYVLVKKRKNTLKIETVIEIAENACLLEKGDSTSGRRFGQLSFSKYLAATYLYNYVAPLIIADKLKLHHTMISYAIRQKLFHKSEFKYLKAWQKEAVLQFINEVKLAGGTINETELKHIGKRFELCQ